MDDKDLQQIRKVFREEFQTGFSQIWEGNLAPAFDSIHEDIGALDERLTIVERKLDKALYKEFERVDKLEKRMKMVEEKLGITS